MLDEEGREDKGERWEVVEELGWESRKGEEGRIGIYAPVGAGENMGRKPEAAAER